MYVVPENAPHDNNTMISVMMDGLAKAKELRACNSLPPHVFVQMDNTNTDNKTKVFMAFCELLVRAGIFKTLDVSFLPVGHTHADVDQAFSRIAVYLDKNPCNTYAELVAACIASFTGVLTWSKLVKRTGIVDCTRWLGGQFNDKILDGIRDQHTFRFCRNVLDKDNHLLFQTKQWMRQEDFITSREGITPVTDEPLRYVPRAVISSSKLQQIVDCMEQEAKGSTRTAPQADTEVTLKHQELRHKLAAGQDNYGHAFEVWGKELEESLALAEASCEVCIAVEENKRQYPTTKSIPKEMLKANRAAKVRIQKELRAHMDSGACKDDLVVHEQDLDEAWKQPGLWDMDIRVIGSATKASINTVRTDMAKIQAILAFE
jgi:hypothetical protein